MPFCDCFDWKQTSYPCKHIFAIIRKYQPTWGCDSLSPVYTSSPYLTLDLFDTEYSTAEIDDIRNENDCNEEYDSNYNMLRKMVRITIR